MVVCISLCFIYFTLLRLPVPCQIVICHCLNVWGGKRSKFLFFNVLQTYNHVNLEDTTELRDIINMKRLMERVAEERERPRWASINAQASLDSRSLVASAKTRQYVSFPFFIILISSFLHLLTYIIFHTISVHFSYLFPPLWSFCLFKVSSLLIQ